MRMFKKMMCLVLALLMTVCVFGCGKGQSNDASKQPVSYIGTWKGSDHDGEKVVHYLIFDEDGYWNIYMNHTSLVKAIRQLPEQLVSFKIFRKLQNSGQTGCHFEYVKNTDDSHYESLYFFDDMGNLVMKDNENLQFTFVSDYVGEPNDTIVEESRDLFDRARTEALLDK